MSKGIMFNEKYGLESAVLNGTKTMTRRDELNPQKKHTEEEWDFINLLYDNDTYTEEHFDGKDTFTLNCNDGEFHAFKTRYAVGEMQECLNRKFRDFEKERKRDE